MVGAWVKTVVALHTFTTCLLYNVSTGRAHVSTWCSQEIKLRDMVETLEPMGLLAWQENT